MSTANAILLIPMEVTPAMIATGTTVPEVDVAAGEVAWSSGTAYTVGQEVNYNGWIWSCVVGNTGVEPGSDATKWYRERPSNRMAAFDTRLDTVTRRGGEIKYVLRPGFFSGFGIYGMEGEFLDIKIYDQPGGTLIQQHTTDLWEQAAGLYELLFMPLRRRTQQVVQDVPLNPNPEIHITVSAAGDAPCGIAAIVIGHWETLIGAGEWGGTEYGAEAEVKSYSYLRRNDDGTVTRVRRGSASNADYSVVIPMDEANHAMELLHRAQGRPVAFIASGLPRYQFLNGFGDISGSVRAETHGLARVSLRLEGAVQEARN